MSMAHSRTASGRPARLLAVVIAALVAALALPGVALAAPNPSYLRLAHISPNTPNVDVYLGSVGDPNLRFTVPGVGYGSVSEYQALPADTYTISMRAAGAPADTPPVITTTLTTKPGAAYTVAGTGLSQQLALSVLDDELGVPPAGEAGIRVINGAATAPTAKLAVAGGAVIAEGIAFARSTDYRSVPTGNWTVDVTTPGRPSPTSLPIDVAANAVYTVLLLDQGGGLFAHLDSAGAAAVPVGGVDTGGSGTAAGTGTAPTLPLLTAGLVGVLVGLAGFGRRLRRGASTR